MGDFLIYEKAAHVVTLTMNQPDVRNALTGNTAVEEFVEAFARISVDASVRAVIVTGAGTVFSSGGNVKDMRRFVTDDIDPVKTRNEYRHGIQRLTLAVYNTEVPTIAAVNVDLPWSMWPIVPTLTCGFVLWNCSLAIAFSCC